MSEYLYCKKERMGEEMVIKIQVSSGEILSVTNEKGEPATRVSVSERNPIKNVEKVELATILVGHTNPRRTYITVGNVTYCIRTRG